MQQYPLLQTKLYIPPVRPGLITRPHLIERLNAGLDRKLALISAPAGFGKTMLMAECIAEVSSLGVRPLAVGPLPHTAYAVIAPHVARQEHRAAICDS